MIAEIDICKPYAQAHDFRRSLLNTPVKCMSTKNYDAIDTAYKLPWSLSRSLIDAVTSPPHIAPLAGHSKQYHIKILPLLRIKMNRLSFWIWKASMMKYLIIL